MLFIILPVYNEQDALPLVLADISEVCSELPYQIVIVNDGSVDQTAEVLMQWQKSTPQLQIITHPQNRGLSEALMSGFQWVVANQAELVSQQRGRESLGAKDLVITLDADNTHPADRIILLAAKIQQGDDLVIASRYVKGGRQVGLGFRRRVLSLLASWLMHLFFPIEGVRDYSCGYRAYRLGIVQEGLALYGKNLIESRSFAGMVELLLKVAPLCQTVSEIPLELHYERKTGASKMKTLATIWGYFCLIYSVKRRKRSQLEWVEE